MNKTVFLVNLSINCGYVGVNHGLARLVPVLKERGFSVYCLNVARELSDKEFRDAVVTANPAIVGFSGTSHQIKYFIQYSNALNDVPDIIQIAGGVGSTLDYEQLLNESRIQGCCIGEGEVPMAQLLEKFERREDITDTQGFFFKVNGAIKKNSIPMFVSDLDTLANPDYSLFSLQDVVQEGGINIMLSRGCPYNCYYCCNKALSEFYPSIKGYFRLPSPQKSIQHIKSLIRQYPQADFLGFEDDLLIARKDWFLAFSQAYTRQIGLPYRLAVRSECVDEDIVSALKKSGCYRVAIGLESGNEYLRKTLLNRSYTNKMLVDRCKMIQRAGIHVFTFNIVGFPLETKKEMQETYLLNKQVQPESGVCTFFYPYKNTALYNICKEHGLLIQGEDFYGITNYNSTIAIKMPSKLAKECRSIQKKLMSYFAFQSFKTGLRSLPRGIKRYYFLAFYTVKWLSSRIPVLKKIIKNRRIRAMLLKMLGKKPK